MDYSRNSRKSNQLHRDIKQTSGVWEGPGKGAVGRKGIYCSSFRMLLGSSPVLTEALEAMPGL